MSEESRKPHGRMVGRPGGYRAYVPAPAPPPLTWDGDLAASLSSADRAIGRLAGEGRRLPNPHVLGMTTDSGPTVMTSSGPTTRGHDQLVWAPPLADVVTRRR